MEGGQGRCEGRSEVFVKIQKIGVGVGSGGGPVWGVRVDVNEEFKSLRKLKKNRGSDRGVRWGQVGGGSGWM